MSCLTTLRIVRTLLSDCCINALAVIPGVACIRLRTNCSVSFNVPFNVPLLALFGLTRFIKVTVKKPLVLKIGSGSPASFINSRIRGTPEPTFSTTCIRRNDKSRRVCEKCGFTCHHSERDKATSLGDKRTEHFYTILKP